MRFSCRPKQRAEVVMSHAMVARDKYILDLRQVSSSKSCLGTISTSPTSGIFRVLHNGGCANSSTGSVNQLTSSLFIPLLKLRTYSTWKILSLKGFLHALSTNFPVHAVTLVTLAKQSDTFPSSCTSTRHRTDRFMFISTYRFQSLVILPVT